MTPIERAEYIIKWMRVGPLTIHPEEVRFISGQIEEATADGFRAARDKAAEIAERKYSSSVPQEAVGHLIAQHIKEMKP